MLKQFLPLAIATGLIVLGMLYQGKQTDRWGDQDSALLSQFTANLPGLPREISDWSSIDTPLSEKEFELTNCTSYVSRVYTGRESKQEVSMYSVVGTARNVTIHSPDWCYVGAGFEMEGDAKPFNIHIEGQDHEFTTATFRKEETSGVKRLRIFWSYTDDGKWLAPSLPKSYFGGRPALCKTYLITPIDEQEDPIQSPSIAFAKVLIPALNAELFREPISTTSPTDSSPTDSLDESDTDFLNDLSELSEP